MSNVFNRAKLLMGTGALDLSGATLKVLLLQSGYSYDPDDEYVSDLVPASNEISVGGYSRQALSVSGVIQNDTLDSMDASAAMVTFSSLVTGETIAAAAIFVDSGVDATSTLVAFFSFTPAPTNGGDVKIMFSGTDPGEFLRLTD